MKRSHRWLAALAAVIVAALFVPAGALGAPKSELVVVAGMWSPPNNFSPINTDSSYGYYCVRFIFQGLLEARLENNQMKFYPALASRWQIGADRQTFTFTIHPKASWHDGRPVTSDDVLFTVMTISDPKTQTNRGAYIAHIAGLTAGGKRTNDPLGFKILSPKTFEVKTKAPVDPNSFLEFFGANIYILPKHILGNVPPEELTRHPYFMAPTVANGPFKFVQYKTDQFVEFVANDAYHLGAPKVRRVFVRIIPPTTMLAQLERQDLDVSAGFGIGEILVEDWDRVKAMPHIRTISIPAPGYQFMSFNFKRDYLTDKRVRRAIAHAINRPLIVNQLLKGEAQIAEGPIPPSNPYFNKNVKPWAYDPNRAKALLQEAGFDLNRTLVLRVPTGNILRERTGDIIRENLVAVGLKVEIQKTDFPTHLAALYAANYDLALVGWAGPTDPDVSSQFRTGAQYNFTHHSIARMDQLLDDGKVQADPDKRRATYNSFQELFADELPYVVLYYASGRTAIAKRMTSVQYDATGLFDFQTFSWVAGTQ